MMIQEKLLKFTLLMMQIVKLEVEVKLANVKVAGTLHWVSVAHALETEVRLYDRLFFRQAPDSHKDKAS
jgi:hypothetical protein